MVVSKTMPVCPRCRERFSSSERYCPQDAAVLVEEIDISRIGERIGNYRLDEILGRGGMGTVYSGEHVYIRKKVAVKVLHAQFARYEGAVARFLREAQAASSIQHPNIVDVTDFGTMPQGGVYFVMEYLEGTSLEDSIEKRGYIELHRALNITNQLALALASAHEKHIVHRDLKPDNIMLIRRPGRRNVVRAVSDDPNGEDPDGEDPNARPRIVTERESDYDFVKILDFGIAKVRTAEEIDADTVPGTVFGTPEYMSPEAARGEDVDLRADVYSLGVILFDMLTGRPPFDAENASEVLVMHISKPPPRPREVAPRREITEACERLILKALAKDPADRHQDMDELRDELQHCYGSVAYRRNAVSIPGVASVGRNARGKRLTEEIDEWLHSDPSGISLEQARMLATRYRGQDESGPSYAYDLDRHDPGPAPGCATPPPRHLTPDEEERLADALDAALDDEGDF